MWKNNPKIQQHYKDIIYNFFSQKEIIKYIFGQKEYSKEDKMCLNYIKYWYCNNFEKYRNRVYKQTLRYADSI